MLIEIIDYLLLRYETHPNQYLPRYHLNSEPETDDERGRFLNNAARGSPIRSKRSNLVGHSPHNFLFLPPASPKTHFLPPASPASTSFSHSAAGSTSHYSPPTGLRIRNNRRPPSGVLKRISLPTTPDDDDEAEGISLFGATSNASDGDRVCDIDDSEVNSEFEGEK